MADPTEMRVKEQRRAEALRANLKRRKTQARARDADTEAVTNTGNAAALPTSHMSKTEHDPTA